LAAKAILDEVAGAHLGEIDFSNVVAEGDIAPTQLHIQIDSSLNPAVSGDVSASGSIAGDADVHLTPLSSVFTACFPLKTIQVPTTSVQVTAVSPTFSSKFTSVDADDGLEFQLSLQQTTLHLGFTIDPLLHIILNNPSLFVTCPLPTGVGVALGSMDQVFNFDKSVGIDQKDLPPQTIGVLSVQMPGQEVKTKLSSQTNSLAVGVVEVVTH
jgi:hypothetical protein